MKKRYYLILILIFLVLLISIFYISQETTRRISTSEINKIRQEMKACGFGIFGVGAAQSDSIQFLPDPQNQLGCVAKFTVRPGDLVNRGNRAEINRNFLDPPGSEVWYSWNFLIPNSYIDTTFFNQDTNKGNWVIIGQFHGEPDPNNFTQTSGRSPPISFGYAYFSKDDPGYDRATSIIKTQNAVGFIEGWDNQPVLALGYGTPSATIAYLPINKGKWYNVVLHVKWSQENDGFIEVFVNDVSMTQGKVYGPNMDNQIPNYLKVGMYREPSIPHTNSIYFSKISYGRTRPELSEKQWGIE
jgi:hypothetical protein